MASHPTLADIYAARRRVAGLTGLVHATPLVASSALSSQLDGEVRLKLELVQQTGAFKVRGAANAILAQPEAVRRRGIVTYSTGNHGRAVAHVAAKLGLAATICVSTRTAKAKIEALARTGARVRIEGNSQDEAVDIAKELVRTEGVFLVDPINDANTISGHGTIGLEIVENFPDLDTIVVPVSGGALICGVALAAKSANPSVRIIAVSMDRGAAMHDSLRAGKPVLVEEADSLADSLQGGILLDNRHTFEMMQKLVDEVVLVSETEIARSMAYALRQERLVVEGAAATPIAALAFHDRSLFGERIAAVLTGSMVEVSALLRIAQDHPGDLGRP